MIRLYQSRPTLTPEAADIVKRAARVRRDAGEEHSGCKATASESAVASDLIVAGAAVTGADGRMVPQAAIAAKEQL